MKIEIVIKRAEGPSHLCRIPHTRESFEAATELLRSWQWSVSPGGYDKCDFWITSSTHPEFEYKGRYDLWADRPVYLKDQVLQFIRSHGPESEPWLKELQEIP